MPSVQSAETIKTNSDLLRRVAAAIGLAGVTLVEACERIILDVRAEMAAVDGAVRLDAFSEAADEG